MLTRVALGALAAAAVVWLALLLHGVALREDGQAIALRDPDTLSSTQVERALSLLERARARTPDTEPIIAEAALLIRVDQPRRARPLLEEVVRREPENVQGWGLLVLAARATGDRARADQAQAKARALAPEVPPPSN